MNKLLQLILLTIIINNCYTLYSSDTKVVQLTKNNFESLVLQSDDFWLVEFYAPWCGHCKNLAPEWEKAAIALKGYAKIGAVDMTQEQEVGSPYDIKGFPTIKFFGGNKQSPQDYNGGRTAKDIITFLFNEQKKVALNRLKSPKQQQANNESNKNNSSNQQDSGTCNGNNEQATCGGNKEQSNSGENNEQAGNNNTQENLEIETDGDVIVLTNDNFEELVLKSQEAWFIKFYAPWCGHCKSLQPEWEKLATNLKGEKINVAKLDSTVNTDISQRYQVNGYPTLKFFPPGSKNDSDIIDYSGGRDASTLESWAKEQINKFKQAIFLQLTNQQEFDEHCVNFNGVCIIFILPHIYDSSAAQRNNYLNLIQEIIASNKSKPINYLWSQAGDYYDFEEKYGVSSSGYPAAIAMSHKKNVYTLFKGTFNLKNLEMFMKKLISGKSDFKSLIGIPKFTDVSKWDGKDSQEQQQNQEL